ncbi:MAG: hypothetical protein KQA34_02115 [Candidatus Aenigmarchaeota archaeon]|nr:hypothetical protein [Candidatus Aenigmarchaeota archaeon]
MRLISSPIYFSIYIVLSLFLISFLSITFKDLIERSKTSSAFLEVIEQLRVLDATILYLNSLDIGSKTTVKIYIPEGRLVVKDGKIFYELETVSTFEFLRNIARSFGNLALIFKDVSIKCEIREDNCLEDEECIFSMYKLNNSHIADCNSSNYRYKVCCKGLEIRKAETCYEEESEILRILKDENSHAGFNKYSFRICSYPIVICSLKNKCSNNEVCIASFYKDFNSHAAICNYYPNNLCCYSSISEVGRIILNYLDIEIVGSFATSRGEYTLVIEKIDLNKIKIYVL